MNQLLSSPPAWKGLVVWLLHPKNLRSVRGVSYMGHDLVMSKREGASWSRRREGGRVSAPREQTVRLGLESKLPYRVHRLDGKRFRSNARQRRANRHPNHITVLLDQSNDDSI